MSINVTVNGNPVNIKRGRMITAAPQELKKEYDKRRLLRLEQVRQQSKEMAENVRHKVQKEKKRQLGELEKEGRENLKNWQNRKLLELQNQYLEAMEDIGSGHKAAAEFVDEIEEMEAEAARNLANAKLRGQLAQAKLQVKSTEEVFNKALPMQQKKIVRDLENERAALLSYNVRKSPKKCVKSCKAKVTKKKNATDINITIPNRNDSDFSETITSSSSESIPREIEDSEGFCEDPECSEAPSPRGDHSKTMKNKPKLHSPGKYSPTRQVVVETSQVINQPLQHREPIQDTRISDRIRQRQLLQASQPDFCDFATSPGNAFKTKRKDPLELSSDDCAMSNRCDCRPVRSQRVACAAVQTDLGIGMEKCCQCSMSPSKAPQSRCELIKPKVKTSDIPSRPAVKLKDTTTSPSRPASKPATAKPASTKSPNKRFDDRSSTSQVEKVVPESLEILPDLPSDADWYEKMRQRDKEAHERGKRAMDKHRVQQDYKELMKKLPVLQKSEELARIGTDKPEYHMSEQRLKEKEKQRQNRLENAFAQAMPELREKVVTLPSRKVDIPKSNQLYEIIDGDDSRTLNLGKWDTDTRPKTMFTAEEVQEIIKAFTMQEPQDRKAKLKQLLRGLKLQKDQLLNEIKALPKDESIEALISDLTSFSDADEKRPRKSRPPSKRRIDDSDSSNTSMEVAEKVKQTSKVKKCGKSPYKKVKRIERRVIVLQNISTQTTPKPEKQTTNNNVDSSESQPTNSSESKDLPAGIKICSKNHVPCDCYQSENGVSEEVCKIFIKLQDEKPAKIEVLKNTQDTAKQPKSIIQQEHSKSKKSLEKENIKPKQGKKSPRQAGKSKKKSVRPTHHDSEKLHNIHGKESWKDQLSKNSLSTTSTSYLSPPDYTKAYTTASTDVSKQSLYNLRKKPKQKNLSTNTTRSTIGQFYNEDLINYVLRLLSMSKMSVEDLGVSSSNVPTPSQSVIEMETNNPAGLLDEAMRFLNENRINLVDDLPTIVVRPNTQTQCRSPQCENVNCDPEDATDSATQAKESLLAQYANMTDSCTRRIANLAIMIEQLRKEKLEMIATSPLNVVTPLESPKSDVGPNLSDKENSTKYYEFPPHVEKSNQSDSTASMDEEEVNRRLLEIDMSLAEKLKIFREVKEAEECVCVDDTTEHPIDDNQDFIARLQKLINEGRQEPTQESTGKIPESESNEPAFVPFLLDIPKLPILPPAPDVFDDEKRRPPPSRGLSTAKKFNGNISLVPHELSTIVEADSAVSNKVSPNVSKSANDIQSPPKQKSPEIASKKDVAVGCTESTCNVFSSSSSSSKLSSSSSSGDLKSIEAMLRSIGMDWAIPTLHKTQEALALASSSSSGDLSSRQKSSKKSPSASEISLRDFLKKQMLKNVPSSSLNKSDASPGSFIKDCSDLSVIHSSNDKTKQRTSTPVMSNKSSSNKEDQPQLFTGASDISSVRNSSSENIPQKSSTKFHSLAGDDSSKSSEN